MFLQVSSAYMKVGVLVRKEKTIKVKLTVRINTILYVFLVKKICETWNFERSFGMYKDYISLI